MARADVPDGDAPDRVGRAPSRFEDPRDAGRRLAAHLAARADLRDAVVLAVARGGVPVAFEVARGLGLPLDLVLIRRLFVTRGPLDPVCAVSVAGALCLDEEVAAPAHGDARDEARSAYVADALEQFARHERACRGARPAVSIEGRRVILVDNGVRTGSTVRAAVRALRTRGPARVSVAVPVAAPEARAAVETVADELVCLAWPQPFGHVGLWYADFRRPGEEEIRRLLDAAAEGV